MDKQRPWLDSVYSGIQSTILYDILILDLDHITDD